MSTAPSPPVFEERLTGLLAPDAYRFALPLFAAGGLAVALGWSVLGSLLLGLGAFVTLFFRNPAREIPDGRRLRCSTFSFRTRKSRSSTWLIGRYRRFSRCSRAAPYPGSLVCRICRMRM